MENDVVSCIPDPVVNMFFGKLSNDCEVNKVVENCSAVTDGSKKSVDSFKDGAADVWKVMQACTEVMQKLIMVAVADDNGAQVLSKWMQAEKYVPVEMADSKFEVTSQKNEHVGLQKFSEMFPEMKCVKIEEGIVMCDAMRNDVHVKNGSESQAIAYVSLSTEKHALETRFAGLVEEKCVKIDIFGTYDIFATIDKLI